MNFYDPIFTADGRNVKLQCSVSHDGCSSQFTLGKILFSPDFGLSFEPKPDASLPQKAYKAVQGWLVQYRNELLDLIAAGLDPERNKGDRVAIDAIKGFRDAPATIPDDILEDLLAQPRPATNEELAALRRLVRIAQSDTGQSVRCANFLLAWWNAGSCGGFDLTDLWAVDTAIARDMLAVAGLVARHRNYPDVYLDRDTFVGLVATWRPQLMDKDDTPKTAESSERVFYTSRAPYSMEDRRIEVYGDGDMGWYEWRVIENGRIVHDTSAQGYGSPEVALRDALSAELARTAPEGD